MDGDVLKHDDEFSTFFEGITIDKNLTINGNGHVIDASNNGRIFSVASDVCLTLHNITLQNGNYSYNGEEIYPNGGGAIYCNGNFTLNGSNINFVNNFVNSDFLAYGGAIYSSDGNVVVNGFDVCFVNNSAEYGGAISTNSGDVTVNGFDVCFVNNSAYHGGAITSYVGSVVVNGSSIFFVNNSASSSGGAIYSSDDRVFVNGSSIFFVNNSASSGGAINFGSGSSVVNGSSIFFVNNSASSGGAIYFGSGSLVVNGSNISFKSNTASSWGGVIYSNLMAFITINGENINFENNKATYYGGAIDSLNVTVNGSNVCFVNNSAGSSGGAISSSNFFVNGSNVCFVNNSAGSYGGAISSGLVVVDGARFVNNSATNGYGGAIYFNMGVVNGTSFVNNSATYDGGIYVDEEELLNVTNSEFYSNVLDVIYNNSGILYLENNTLFNGRIFNNGTVISDITLNILNNSTLNASYGDEIRLSASLVDDNGNPIVGGSVTLKNTPSGDIILNMYDGGIFYTDYQTMILGEFIIDGNYSNASNVAVNKGTLNVSKATPTVSVNVSNVEYGETIKGNGTISGINGEGVSGTVLIEINNVSQNKILNNGKFEYEFENLNLTSGTYELKITYSGNENYSSISESFSFNVGFVTVLDVVLDKNSYVYGESVVVSGTLTTKEGDPVNGVVDITVDGRTYQVSVNNGEFRLNIPNLDADTYTVTAVFNGDETYAMSSDSARFTVSKANPTINVNVEDIVYGEDAVIHITLGGAYGSLNGNVEVTVGSISETVQVIRGEGVLFVSDLPAGNYTVSAVYAGSANYNSADASVSFNVESNSSFEIEGSGVIIVEGNETRILGNITDVNGNPLNGNFTMVIGNETIKTPVLDGEFEAVIHKIIPAGEYNASILFECDDGRHANTTVVVTVPDAGEIIAEDLVMYYNNGSQFTAQVIVDGMPQANANVTITVNGVSYNRITDEDGFVSMDITLSPGIYDITVSYEDMSVNSTVTVLSTLESSNLVKYYKNGSQYNVLVLDGNGNPLVNSTVEFNINGVFYNRTTDENGVAVLNINLNPGTYIITSINHDGLMVSNNVTVLSTIAADDVVKYHLNDTQYLINVVDSQGNPLANKNVIINIHGVFYNRTTDENGIAVLNINLAPGDYIATVYDLESGLALSNNIKVLPVLSGDDLEMNYHDGSKYNAKLVDSHGNPLEGETITFNINGVFYNKTIDAEGVASLDINLNPGEYIITAYWGEIAHSNTILVKQN